MSSSPDPAGAPSEPAARTGTRRLRWWVAGITFVVGFVAGILTVGLLNLTTPDFAAGAGPGGVQSGPASGRTPGSSVPVVAEAQVNAACLAVINDAQDVYTVLSGLDQAVADVDLQQLDDIVRRLQPIEARLGRDLQQCRIDTGVARTTPGSPGSESPAVPTPTASPS